MTAKKNHHFVPQFYFRRFSTDQRSICTLVRSTGKTFSNAPIKGQASKDWFYGDVETENLLAEIEGVCCTALRELSKLENPTMLADEHIDGLLLHIALQRSRTDAARQANRPLNNMLARLMAEQAIHASSDLDEAAKRELLEVVEFVEAEPVPAQKLAMSVAMEASLTLRDLQPILLINKTTRPFIFGDAPAVFYNPHCRDVVLRGVLGKASSGLVVLLPLTSWTCLMLMDAEVYRVPGGRENCIKVRDLSDVGALNKLQLHAASSCVYFEDVGFSAYVKSLWDDERRRLTAHRGAVNTAPGFDVATKEGVGDIIHGFQPQLAYRPLFTFLKHEVVKDGEPRLQRRVGAISPRMNPLE